MHKIKNIFPIIYDFENLFNAYKAGIKCKRYRPDVMAYTDKLEENLIELQNEFIWQTYTVGALQHILCLRTEKAHDYVIAIQRPGGTARYI